MLYLRELKKLIEGISGDQRGSGWTAHCVSQLIALTSRFLS
jgi:hypothetical protein